MSKPARITLVIAGLFALLTVLLFTTLFAVERGALHGPLLRLVSARAHRPVRVDGGFDIQLFGGGPRVVARQVVVGNPPWMPAGELARIGELTLTFAPSLRQPLRLRGVELRAAVLNPQRDVDGKANWQREEPKGRPGPGGGLPPLQHLLLDEVSVHLRDVPRHLDFTGQVSTLAPGEAGELRLTARGDLNGRPLQASLVGEPLAGVRRDAPWRFRFDERSSGAQVSGTGAVLEPFNLARIDIDFEASGADLKDLVYLVGVRLPDTGAFTASGRLLRRGERIEFRDLRGRSGESDISGSYVSQSGGARPRFTAQLQSRRLRSADLGAKAAGRDKPAAGPPRLLPVWPIPLQGLRLRDGDVSYSAAEMVIGPMTLRTLEAKLRIADGVLTIAPLAAATSGDGKLAGELRFDARRDQPAATLTLRSDRMASGELFRGKGNVPHLEAPVSGSVQLAGQGRSLHELAAHASGELQATLAEGTMRASLAEALGLDLRALGLKLSGSQATLPLRCAVAHFKVSDGKVAAERLMLDSEPVVVQGEGGIDLDSEALDLRLRGQPKHMRLRLRSALEVKGWLAAPSPRLARASTGVQTGAAIALGALVAPVAAAAAFVDPGFAKDQDCAALRISATNP